MAICWPMGFPSYNGGSTIKPSLQCLPIPEQQERVRCRNSFETAAAALDRLMGICRQIGLCFLKGLCLEVWIA